MSRVTAQSQLGSITDPVQFMRSASDVIAQLVDAVNGKIELDKNLKSQTITVVFPLANTDLGIAHNLNRTGLKYFPVSKTIACDVFTGATAATNNTIYLQCTHAATVVLVLM